MKRILYVFITFLIVCPVFSQENTGDIWFVPQYGYVRRDSNFSTAEVLDPFRQSKIRAEEPRLKSSNQRSEAIEQMSGDQPISLRNNHSGSREEGGLPP